MTQHGLQTQDFLERMEKFEQELPPLLLELSQIVKQMVEEIERPQLQDIQNMQEDLLKLLSGSEQLTAVCGTEGKLCVQCPFGAYLPTGFPFASPEQPLCLPWIVLTQPISKQRAESQQK